MDTVAELSSWIQLILMVGMLILARRVAHQFEAFRAWRTIWIAFAIGFMGMLESRVIVILLAYEIEPRWLSWVYRFITPLQASVGLFGGMLLLSRLLAHTRELHGAIHLPHPAGFLVDAQSHIIAWDAGAELLFGCTTAEAMGKTLMELITPPRILGTHIPIVERYLRTGTPHGISQRYTITARSCATQAELSVEIILTAETDAAGATQFRGVARELIPSI